MTLQRATSVGSRSMTLYDSQSLFTYCNTQLTYWQNIFLSTSLVSGTWIAEKDIWDLKILRNSQESHITCAYIVFAVGGGAQFPISPTYEDRVGLAVPRAELK